MQIVAEAPPDKESMTAAQELHWRHGTIRDAIAALGLSFTPGTYSDIERGNWDNVSYSKLKEFREKAGLAPMPEPRVVIPTNRKRKRRYSLPTDPILAAHYLHERWDIFQMEEFVAEAMRLVREST